MNAEAGQAFDEKLSRVEVINFGIDFSRESVIEIGALDKPVTPRDAARVFYVDHVDTPTLQEKYRADANVKAQEIVHVGGVWGQKTLAEAAASVAPVDFIVASHVIEHVPDLVTWLKELDSVLTPAGEVRLVVPDKRYCFDFMRSETEIADVVAAYVAGARVPQPQQIADFTLNAVAVDCGSTWDGSALKAVNPRMYDDQGGLVLAKDALINGTYHDVHCWVFTPLSFARLMMRLVGLGLSSFGCIKFLDTKFNTFEFFVFLKRFEDSEQAARSWQNLIDDIESAQSKKSDQKIQFEISDVATNKIAQLTDELNAARHEATGATAENLALQATVSAQKQMSEQLAGLRKSLEACRQDATRARTEVQALQSTVSWRVTQPLRWVRRLWR